MWPPRRRWPFGRSVRAAKREFYRYDKKQSLYTICIQRLLSLCSVGMMWFAGHGRELQLGQTQRKQHRADGPGDGIGQIDHPDVGDKVYRHRDVGDAQRAPHCQHDGHRDDRASHAAQDTGTAVGEGQQEIEQRHGAGIIDAEHHHGGIVVESADKQRRKGEYHQSHRFSQQRTGDQAEFHAGFHPIVPPGSDVLADKGGQCHRKAGDGQKREALHLAVGAAACHRCRAEGVDVALYNHVGQCDHRVLHAGRDAQRDHLAQHRQIKFHLPPAYPVALLRAGQTPETQEGAHHLAEDGGQRSACHAQIYYRHEYKVEYHVHQRGDDEVFHWAAAVAHRLQNTCAHVVQHHRQRTEEVNPEIQDGVGQHLLGGSHQAQNLGSKYHARNGEHRTRGDAQRHRGVDGTTEVFVVFGAEKARHQHAGTQRDAVDESHHQHNEVARRADRRQCVRTQEVAYD